MHKVFISYHHKNDQQYKNDLVECGKKHSIFIDRSVDTGGISDDLSDQIIREKIRDEYLRDSTVTIVLVGQETQQRKHVDWEIYSSMFDGKTNKRSGILVINLSNMFTDIIAPYGESEKRNIYPDIESWKRVEYRAEYEHMYPFMPARIIDNLMRKDVRISVTNWERIDRISLRLLIDLAFGNRSNCRYDLSRPMRRKNS